MKARNRAGLVLAVLTIAAVGCSSPAPRRDLADLPGTDACFRTRSIGSWTVLDGATLLVRTREPSAVYLVKLFFQIPGLQFDEGLDFRGGAGRPGLICSTNASLTGRSSDLKHRDNEPIVAVRALTPAEANQLLTQWRARSSPRHYAAGGAASGPAGAAGTR